MGAISIWHWLIVALVVLLLFGGRGKLSGLMGDAAKGIRAFREGLQGEDAKSSEKDRAALPGDDKKDDAKG